MQTPHTRPEILTTDAESRIRSKTVLLSCALQISPRISWDSFQTLQYSLLSTPAVSYFAPLQRLEALAAQGSLASPGPGQGGYADGFADRPGSRMTGNGGYSNGYSNPGSARVGEGYEGATPPTFFGAGS